MDQPSPDRPALRRPELPAGGAWTELRVVAETGSTNADLTAAARAGAAAGLVLVAEHQHAGRGRAGRTWSSPPRAGLAVSVLLRPAVPPARWGWLPLLAGVALAGSVTRVTGLPVRLKWPNDLLAGQPPRKCAGILSEVAVAGEAVVVGIGLNVAERAAELPPGATSLALAGAAEPVRTAGLDRGTLLAALLAELADWYGRWRAAGADPDRCGLRDAYRSWCATLGSQVRVRLPDGGELTGTADTVDQDGRLVLRTGTGGHRILAAGDIVHLRGAGP